MSDIALNRFSPDEVIPTNQLQKVLTSSLYKNHKGVLLGASLKTGDLIVLPDTCVNQVVLVLGTTGAGKTVTLYRFIERAIAEGYPLLIIDGKPTEHNVNSIQKLTKKHNRHFYGFNCDPWDNYNALSHGGYTELKDKVITLKDLWDNEYYKNVAADYLQTTFELLLKTKTPIELRTISDCLDYRNLALLVRNFDEPELVTKVKALEHYDRKALTGLQAHINILNNSELGKFLNAKNGFTLEQVISDRAVGYFALPALRFPEFSKILGKLIINDIKSVIEPLSGSIPIFVIIDEFSVFAGEQVLNLINMGRGKGVHSVLGTQGLADLKKVDPHFESQLLNCVNTIICHRLNHQESAESISKWVGTCDSYDITGQINIKQGGNSLGSARKNKSFIFHPDYIKQSLRTGEAIYASKVNGFCADKIKILNYDT